MRVVLELLIVGLVVYVITRLQMMSLEIAWLRKYIMRLLTEEIQGRRSATDGTPNGGTRATEAILGETRRSTASGENTDADVHACEPVFMTPVPVQAKSIVASILQGMRDTTPIEIPIEEVTQDEESDDDSVQLENSEQFDNVRNTLVDENMFEDEDDNDDEEEPP